MFEYDMKQKLKIRQYKYIQNKNMYKHMYFNKHQ